MKLSDLRINSRAVNAGVWIRRTPLNGVAIRTRGLENDDYVELQGRLMVAAMQQAAADGKEMTAADRERVNTECLVRTCLQDFEGLEADDGAALNADTLGDKFHEHVLELLQNPDYRNLRFACFWAASAVAGYRDEVEKAAEGN